MPRSAILGLILISFLSLKSLALIPIPYSLESLRDKELPDFGKQEKALGYSKHRSFQVTPELRSRVEFWKKVYTELTSSQAIIHDSDYPELTF